MPCDLNKLLFEPMEQASYLGIYPIYAAFFHSQKVDFDHFD
jgi:hypothetical protein